MSKANKDQQTGIYDELLKNGTAVLRAKTRDELAELVNNIPAERKTFAGSFGLTRVIPCLLRLKTDGRVEETSAGYFRKTR